MRSVMRSIVEKHKIWEDWFEQDLRFQYKKTEMFFVNYLAFPKKLVRLGFIVNFNLLKVAHVVNIKLFFYGLILL